MGKLTMLLTAADYHDLTSYDRNRMSGHSLDWSNQPVTFKTYHGFKHIELAGNERDSSSQNLDELLDTDTAWTPVSVNFDTLSRVLKLSHCLTRKEKIAGGHFYFRNVASAGALYPSEIYFLSPSGIIQTRTCSVLACSHLDTSLELITSGLINYLQLFMEPDIH